MRCAISLASAAISCIVRLLVMPENTLCGCKTPTTAQTSWTTVNSVMSSPVWQRPRWRRLHCHSLQRLATRLPLRRASGIGSDKLAQLLIAHFFKLGIRTRPGGLERNQIILEHAVAGAQRLELGLHMLVGHVGLGVLDELDRPVLHVATVGAKILQFIAIDRGQCLERVDIQGAQFSAPAVSQERCII